MNIKDKKIIAEWMGWGQTLGTSDNSWDVRGSIILEKDFNPDTEPKPKQFREVIANLTPSQRAELSKRLYKELPPKNVNEFYMYLWITDKNNQPKVMKVVLQVIK